MNSQWGLASKRRTVGVRSSICAGVALLVVSSLSAQGNSEQPAPILDSSASSLRLTLVKEPEKPKFQLELRNVGDHDLVLNLGLMLANGAKQYPNAILFRLTCPDGKQLPLQMIQPTIIAGRVDPMVVPLPVNAKLTLPIDLLDYWAVEGKNVSVLHLAPGRYSLRATFTGTDFPEKAANLDMRGISLMPYWTGTANSNDLTFELDAELTRESE